MLKQQQREPLRIFLTVKTISYRGNVFFPSRENVFFFFGLVEAVFLNSEFC